MAISVAASKNGSQIRDLAEAEFRNAVDLNVARSLLLATWGTFFSKVIAEEYEREVSRRAALAKFTYENTYSDEQLKDLLDGLFVPGLTLKRVREALEAFVPERLLPAVIQAHRAATLVPAELVLLKFEKKELVDHLLPDPKPEVHDESEEPGNPPICEECARAVEEPDHRWCSDCAQRVFFDLPNTRDPQP